MEIRDYKEGDETHILNLFKDTFGKPLLPEYWKWRFIDNPNKQVMIKLMWDNNRMVGHYAVSPLKMNVEGENILSALSMTTMTHPEYAGKGIFTKLAEALYTDKYQNANLKAVWGFPNNNSHYAFINKLNWVDVSPITTRSLAIEKIKNKSSLNSSVVSSFSNQHIKTHEELTANHKIKTDKSIDYLTWRYLNNPVNEYTIFELRSATHHYYAVAKVFASFSEKGKYEIDVLELQFPEDEGLISELMIAIKEYYSTYALLQINIWLSANDVKNNIIEKIGFVNTSQTTYFGIRILDSQYAVLGKSKEWHNSMGDSDVY